MKKILTIFLLLSCFCSKAQDNLIKDLRSIDSLYAIVPPGHELDLVYTAKGTKVFASELRAFNIEDSTSIALLSEKWATDYLVMKEILHLMASHRFTALKGTNENCHATTVLVTRDYPNTEGYFVRHNGSCTEDDIYVLDKKRILGDQISYGNFRDAFDKYVIDSVEASVSKWPYLGEEIPPYLGIIAGYEGFGTKNFTVGITHNLFMSSAEGDFGKTGARIGYSLYYKRNLQAQQPSSFEIDLGIFYIPSLGININYNIMNAHEHLIGIKPFVGISLYHVDFLYGYCFYQDKKDQLNVLRHNRFTVRLSIPVAKLSKRKTVKHYVYKYPFEDD